MKLLGDEETGFQYDKSVFRSYTYRLNIALSFAFGPIAEVVGKLSCFGEKQAHWSNHMMVDEPGYSTVQSSSSSFPAPCWTKSQHDFATIFVDFLPVTVSYSH